MEQSIGPQIRNRSFCISFKQAIFKIMLVLLKENQMSIKIKYNYQYIGRCFACCMIITMFIQIAGCYSTHMYLSPVKLY